MACPISPGLRIATDSMDNSNSRNFQVLIPNANNYCIPYVKGLVAVFGLSMPANTPVVTPQVSNLAAVGDVVPDQVP